MPRFCAAPSSHPWARCGPEAADRSMRLGARELILFTLHNPLQLREKTFRLLLELYGAVGGEDWEGGCRY